MAFYDSQFNRGIGRRLPTILSNTITSHPSECLECLNGYSPSNVWPFERLKCVSNIQIQKQLRKTRELHEFQLSLVRDRTEEQVRYLKIQIFK
jgi:hypothetical protein